MEIPCDDKYGFGCNGQIYILILSLPIVLQFIYKQFVYMFISN